MDPQIGTFRESNHALYKKLKYPYLVLMALMWVSCSEETRTYHERVLNCWSVEPIESLETKQLKLSTTVIYLATEAPISGAEKCSGESMTVDFDRHMILPFVENEEVLSLGSKDIPVFDVIVEGTVDEMRSTKFNIVFDVKKMNSVERNIELTAQDIMDRAVSR